MAWVWRALWVVGYLCLGDSVRVWSFRHGCGFVLSGCALHEHEYERDRVRVHGCGRHANGRVNGHDRDVRDQMP